MNEKYPYNNVRALELYGPLLTYSGLVHYGTLNRSEDKRWYIFRYAPCDYPRPRLRGLPAESDSTSDLKNWDFFYKRIPSLKRADVRAYVKEHGVNTDDPFALIASFGHHFAVDPYLIAARF